MNRLSDVLTIRDGEIKPRRRRETIKVCAHCGEEVDIIATPDHEEHFVFCPNCEIAEVETEEIESD